MFVIENDLFKAGGHKYIKRTGTPGNYKYWYKDASGRLVSHEDDSHEGAKIEHLKRLIAGRMRGSHAMTDAEMSAHTGLDRNKVGQHVRNMRRPTNRSHESYDENQLHEAKHGDVSSEEYTSKIARIKEEIARRGSSESTSERRAARPAASSRRERSAPAAAPAQEASGSSASARAAKPAAPTETPEQKREREKQEKIRQKREQLRTMFGVDLEGGAQAPEAPASSQDMRDAQIEPADEAQDQSRSEREQMMARVNAMPEPEQVYSVTRNGREATVFRTRNEDGEDRFSVSGDNGEHTGSYTSIETAKRYAEKHVGPSASPRSATQSQAQAQEAVRAAQADLQSEETQELHQASPELASMDRSIEEMVAQQAAGKNPYVQRAKKFYDRIKGDMTPIRRDTLKNLFKAFETVGENVGENAIKSAYARAQAESGVGETAWSKVKGHISPGLFHDPEELFDNEPVNVDMERMKRGFGKMQFERMKPFLGDAFKSAHPDAPPPYPTYDDLKTWEEHGSRPEWATAGPGRAKTKRAVPKEFHDSMPKGPDGKVLNPPGWMPLHMTPVWNYIATRAGADAYREPAINSNEMSQQKLNFPSQGQLAGHLKNSLRNFIQMRGENSFADIPKAKAAAYNIDLKDLYKSDESDLNKVLATKVIPMGEFMKYLKTQKMTKKSITLCVGDLGPVNFKKSFTIDESVKKSELIAKIKSLKEVRA